MKFLNKLALSVALVAMLGTAAVAQTPPPEKKDLTLGVGGKSALYYLQLTLTERLGYFKEQGLEVSINDFRGGAQSLQALVGGSVDGTCPRRLPVGRVDRTRAGSGRCGSSGLCG